MRIQSKDGYLALRESHPYLPENVEIAWRDEWVDWPTFTGHEITPYVTYWLAKQAVAALNIISEQEYNQDYLLDPMLPEHPYQVYRDYWQGWDDYLAVGERYATINEASAAAYAIGLTTQADYEYGYHRDPKLPRRPDIAYKSVWKTWTAFHSIPGDYYEDYEQAKLAARALKFSNTADYLANHDQRDNRLPRQPRYQYKEWSSWDDYLGLESPFFSYAEAMAFICKNNIKTQQQYRTFSKSHAGLPGAPARIYHNEWIDWATFTGNTTPPSERKYDDFNEARRVARSHKFHSKNHYIRNCLKLDSRFRTGPHLYFSEDWNGWDDYLGLTADAEPFTYEEARALMQEENIQSSGEYSRYRRNNPRLPWLPDVSWREEWVDWPTFLGKSTDPYPNYLLAKEAVRKLSIVSEEEYTQQFRRDSMLPEFPDECYSDDWTGWQNFLAPGERYANASEARIAVLALGLTTQSDYESGFHRDPKLPRHPDVTYKNDWRSWEFFCALPGSYYESFNDAKSAARALAFTDRMDYVTNYNRDTRLFRDPVRNYTEWSGWDDYLGLDFLSYKEAQALVQKENIQSRTQYFIHREHEPRLPNVPEDTWKKHWVDWPKFLGQKIEPYLSYRLARSAAINLNIVSEKEYSHERLLDPMLPEKPYEVYKDQWKGWQDYLMSGHRYATIREASIAARALGFSNDAEYEEGYRKDSSLPRRPDILYKHHWKGWEVFLGQSVLHYTHYEDAKRAARALGFKDRQDYISNYKLRDKRLLVAPKNYYEDWTDWKDYLGTQKESKYLSYEKAIELLRDNDTKTHKEYHELRMTHPGLPAHPKQNYRDQWIDWPTFFGILTTPGGKKYKDFNEARKVARSHNFRTQSHYIRNCLRIDSRFHTAPDRVFTEWNGWEDYLGIDVEADFFRYEEAKALMREQNIQSNSQYLKYRGNESRLPRMPQITWKEEWIDWPTFLGQRIDPYPTYEQAQAAAKVLDVLDEQEYRKDYLLDPRLPKHPYRLYEQDWKGWDHYLARGEKYGTLAEASAAARALGFSTQAHYEAGRHLDIMLPRRPETTYKDEWASWNAFYGRAGYYPNFEDARKAARAIGFRSSSDYVRRAKTQDAMLHEDPENTYETWTGWDDYLGLNSTQNYLPYEDAVKFVRENNVSSQPQYIKLRKKYKALPADPSRAYRDDWIDWLTFLTHVVRPYETYQEAKQAVLALGIASEKEYHSLYLNDPKLPKHPYHFYEKQWADWEDFLCGIHYATLEEAGTAARALGFSTKAQYESDGYLDCKLPRHPEFAYEDSWKGWKAFLGSPDHYEHFDEARNAARALRFISPRDYVRRCRSLDDSLYVAPENKYDAWAGWDDYLGLNNQSRFLDYDEAMSFVREHNIQTHSQYAAFRKEHTELPCAPSRVYSDFWIDWPTFLSQRIAPYSSYQQAKQAVVTLGITTDKEYKSHYLDDPKLPKHPYRVYESDWKGWNDFLYEQEKYSTAELASQKACALGFKTRQDYDDGHASDPMLPKRPDLFYEQTWPAGGWAEFLTATPLYATVAEAAAAARALGLVTLNDYNEKRHADPRLPASPRQYYGAYTIWLDFILPEKCASLANLKFAIKAIGIKDSRDYRIKYKQHPCLPAHPERVFSNEWIDWYDACEIVRPYCYNDAVALLRKLHLSSSAAYNKYVKKSGDSKFPLTPDKVYGDEWINWQAYLGKEEPYTLITLREPYQKWRFAFADYLRTAKKGFKVHHLVMFIRDYLKPNNLSEDPITFFTTRDFDREDYKEFLLLLPNKKSKENLSTLRDFSEHFIEKHLSARCEDTGDVVPVAGALNPFLRISLPSLKAASPGQTTKPPLAYHHVDALRKWIAPPSAASFSDLKHLHNFENDWVDVDKSLIDESDPDCVYVESNGRCRIWFPGYWMHTFALASVPIRGVQLAYADSGECDLQIPVMQDGKLVWIDNPSHLRGQTVAEGFIKQDVNNEYGMHLTTNKTAEGITGYDVPWMPEDLAKWMIKLRDWQSKYNPVNRPLPWSECQNTNYCEADRLAKGSNCFLFRDFGFEECGASFGSRLYRRIAIALYNTAPGLATMSGSPHRISSYHSDFTPHAMRVSLITAYVMEFRLPLNVIVKIVGHASIIMTIYYVKINGELLRQKFNEAEKRYMHQQSKGAYQSLVEGRTQELKHAFLTDNEDAIQHLAGQVAAGSALYRDYGICLTAASRCGDGASIGGKFAAVPAGYLGRENCIQCRHFVTGPVFLGGLLSLANEISLCCRTHLDTLGQMQDKQIELRQEIKKLTTDRFDEAQSGVSSGVEYKTLIEEAKRELIALDGLVSTASIKADMYLADMNVVNKLTQQCQALIAERASNDYNNDSTQLIVKPEHEAVVTFEEVSLFKQLNEVCENAEIYASASAELAAPDRSNMIDRMAELNRLTPAMYKLNKKSQLVVGNQIVKFMLARMSWPTVEGVMDGSILMKDLPADQRLTSGAFLSLLQGKKAQDVLKIEYQPKAQPGDEFQALPSHGGDHMQNGYQEGAQ